MGDLAHPLQGRKRVETVGIILFCALMTTVSVELIIESARSLADGPKDNETLKPIPLACVGVAILSKATLFVYCFALRRYPAARIFMLDHRNDIVVNVFGLIMSIVGTKFKKVWFLDPAGAIAIACLILFSWASTAFEHMWLLVGKSAPQEFLNKLVYVAVTHDPRIIKIDTVC
jgi:divalent metal cation (Fe/Co/Zn/Cd) transporter